MGKKCTKCGAEISGKAKFCSVCGASIEEQVKTSQNTDEKIKLENKGKIAVITAIAVVALAGGGYALVSGMANKNVKEEKTVKQETDSIKEEKKVTQSVMESNTEKKQETTPKFSDLKEVEEYKKNKISDITEVLNDNEIEYTVSANGDIVTIKNEYQILGEEYQMNGIACSLCDYKGGKVDDVINIQIPYNAEKEIDKSDNKMKLIYELLRYTEGEAILNKYDTYEQFLNVINNYTNNESEIYVSPYCKIIIENQDNMNILKYSYYLPTEHSIEYSLDYISFETYEDYNEFRKSAYDTIREATEDEHFKLWNGSSGDANGGPTMEMAYDNECVIKVYFGKPDETENNNLGVELVFSLSGVFEDEITKVSEEPTRAKVIEFINTVLDYVKYDDITADEILNELLTARMIGSEECYRGEYPYLKGVLDSEEEYTYGQYPNITNTGWNFDVYIPIEVEGCLNK